MPKVTGKYWHQSKNEGKDACYLCQELIAAAYIFTFRNKQLILCIPCGQELIKAMPEAELQRFNHPIAGR